MQRPRRLAGLTMVEVIVILVIIGVFIYLAIPAVTIGPTHSPYTRLLNNQRQLTLATQQMALDGFTSEDPQLGWPGDTGGTYSNWVGTLVKHNYLTLDDLSKLLAGPGLPVKKGQLPPMADTAIRVYAVSSNSSPSTVLLTSANFTNTPTGGILTQDSSAPLGNQHFVVFRKGGDGSIYRARSVGNTNVVGEFAPLCRE